MRPPVLPSGNTRNLQRGILPHRSGFNEAAGFTQRKLPARCIAAPRDPTRFNEAAGFTQRKLPVRASAPCSGSNRFNEAAGFTQRKR